MTTMHCLICDRVLDLVAKNTTQPWDGLTFVAHGNYGSRVYDPFKNRTQLHAVICDACVTERLDRIMGVTPTAPPPTFEYRRLVSVKDLTE